MTASTHSKPASTKAILERWEAFNTIAGPYLEPITTPAEYEAADALLNDISDRMSSSDDRQYINLFRLLAARIQAWEDEHEPLPSSTPHELLAFLLEQHQLRQSDLSNIVDQSTLSKILRGERGISKRLAFALSERFGLPVAAFLEMK